MFFCYFSKVVYVFFSKVFYEFSEVLQSRRWRVSSFVVTFLFVLFLIVVLIFLK